MGVSMVYDLSATPFFLRGSGYREGTLFRWTMSDFSLMDAIECGIVKLPRVPVADNVPGGDTPKFRNLWDTMAQKMPKKGRRHRKRPRSAEPSAGAAYGARRPLWPLREDVRTLGRSEKIGVPPVFIVVCNNTSTSNSSTSTSRASARERRRVETCGKWPSARCSAILTSTAPGYPRPNTILIDCAQLESGEALDKDFRAMAETKSKSSGARSSSGRATRNASDKIDDATLLREVMNTVGKKGKLGEQIRCVVSVSMLTEGWDANTVTHILGVRAFGTQLLCEQVVGRGLRRQSYELNEEGLFNVEYADVFGIPFDFAAKPVVSPPAKPRETIRVHAVKPDRDALEILFPRVEGYGSSCPRSAWRRSSAPIRCWN